MSRKIFALLMAIVAAGAGGLGSIRDGATRTRADRGQLGIFMVLVFGAVALVVVSIVLLFGMDIAGDFAANIGQGDSFTVNNETFSGTSSFTYTVDREPGEGNTVSLNDDETVFNRTSGTELTEGTGYNWTPSTGVVEIDDDNEGSSGDYNISYSGNEHQYAAESASTVDSTGNAFQLFGTSVLVIPAAAVLAVLIGGLVGAVTMVGGGALPGMGGQPGQTRRRR